MPLTILRFLLRFTGAYLVLLAALLGGGFLLTEGFAVSREAVGKIANMSAIFVHVGALSLAARPPFFGARTILAFTFLSDLRNARSLLAASSAAIAMAVTLGGVILAKAWAEYFGIRPPAELQTPGALRLLVLGLAHAAIGWWFIEEDVKTKLRRRELRA